MTVILIRKKLLCSNFSSNLISGFAKNANLSKGIFKVETRMHAHAMKVQQNGHKCHTPPSHHRKGKTVKTRSIYFLIRSFSMLQII